LEIGRNSLDFSKGVWKVGMSQFESSQVSQPVRLSWACPEEREKGPPTAGFRDLAAGLHLPV